MAEESIIVPLTASEKFYQHFQLTLNDIQSQIDRIETSGTPAGEQADAIDHCLSAISRLSSEVNEASSYLPAYDQRTCGEAIKASNKRLQQVRSSFAPKPRFSFRSKPLFTATKNESAISLGDAAELAKQRSRRLPGSHSDVSNDSSFINTPVDPGTPHNETAESGIGNQTERQHDHTPKQDHILPDNASTSQPPISRHHSVNITARNNAHIILPSSTTTTTSSGIVSHIQRSVIDMSLPTKAGKAFPGLTLKGITSSLILCGRVDGAVHLTDIAHSVIVVTSRQFRMHASTDCTVYLFASSRPIIEDCTAIRFAPIPDAFLTTASDAAAAAAAVQNQWSSIDDFKWLKSEPSPNWSVLEQSGWIADQVWGEIVPGGPGIGVEDILIACNISRSST